MVHSDSTKSSETSFMEGTLELESGLKINYVAPAHETPIKENSSIENSIGSVSRKKSFIEGKIYSFGFHKELYLNFIPHC